MKLTDLNNVEYIALETFRKNGEGIVTPVWQVPEDGKLFVWTEDNSWKVKRIRNNSRVKVCESDGGGNPQSEWIEAQARLIDDATEEQKQRKRLASKYGLKFRFLNFISSLLGRGKNGIVIEISTTK